MDHELASIGPHQFSSELWVAECECHNPDGNWHGRADWYGDTRAEAYDQWLDHHNEKVL